MRFRHASALAIVYLMLAPPQTSRSPLRFDADAPLNKWYMSAFFDSAAECENYKQEMNRRWLMAARGLNFGTIRDIQQYQAQELCIASDDQRLKTE
jgi:hypothetical protein